jgi:23S rRNA (guanosine2251-2'-O)-methyltransferase
MPHKHKGERSRTSEIFGVNPVLEALRAKRRAIREITIANGTKDARLAQLLELARADHVPVHYAPRQQLDRATGNAIHQPGARPGQRCQPLYPDEFSMPRLA